MNITITVDTDTPLNDTDKAVLLALAGVESATVAPAEPEPTEEEKPKRRTRRTKEQIAADKAAEEAAKKEAQASEDDPADTSAEDDSDEDLLGGDGPTMKDAVDAATDAIAKGKTAKVKAALAEAGAKRVSELTDDSIPTFLSALKG